MLYKMRHCYIGRYIVDYAKKNKNKLNELFNCFSIDKSVLEIDSFKS